MTPAAKSVLVFGLYLVVVGLGLVAAPNPFLAPLGFPHVTDESWPRIVGVLTLCLATYYCLAARAEMTAFFRWTVYVRVGVFLVLGAFVVLGLAPKPVALLGAIDLGAALWTASALRRAGSGFR